ncbi:MAG: P1 family peptidase [Parvularculaceae bacterium]|jgi:L-aminopeptidase/D-esterase-like protein|nr:P1 family peptidase [Parvularculaceae bacterium]
MLKPGPRNLVTDVAGLLVGHATDAAAETGVTVVLCEDHYCAGADVRGGAPGVREIETLSPENLVGRAHAFVLTGGSVFGLAAADGAVQALADRGVGYAARGGGVSVPIVPAAVIFDLANGGDKNWGATPPYHALGRAAVAAAAQTFEIGRVGGGRGARAGLHWGGLGSASLDLGGGLVAGAVVVNNAVGSAFMPDGRTPWAYPFEIGGEFGGPYVPQPAPIDDPLPDQSKLAGMGRLAAGANTTIGLVAVSADLSTAELKRIAMMAHDGLSRAVRPAHTPFDGDAIFAVSTARVALADGLERALQLARIGSAAADCLTRAIARGVHAAAKEG